MDVKETKELVVFVCRSANAVDLSLSDGKIGLADAGNLIGPLMSAGPGVAGAQMVPKELADLDPLEAVELAQVVQQELDLRQDAVEAVTEQVVGAALQLAAAINAARLGKAKTVAPAETPQA